MQIEHEIFMSEIRKIEDLGVKLSKVARLKVLIGEKISGKNPNGNI